MNLSTVTPQHVTSASGTIAIASTSTSITTQRMLSDAPASAQELIQTAHEVISTADMIALASCLVLISSFAWNIYSSRKKQQMDEKFYILRQQELELEKEKFLREINN